MYRSGVSRQISAVWPSAALLVTGVRLLVNAVSDMIARESNANDMLALIDGNDQAN